MLSDRPRTAGAMKKAFIDCAARRSFSGTAFISPLILCSAEASADGLLGEVGARPVGAQLAVAREQPQQQEADGVDDEADHQHREEPMRAAAVVVVAPTASRGHRTAHRG